MASIVPITPKKVDRQNLLIRYIRLASNDKSLMPKFENQALSIVKITHFFGFVGIFLGTRFRKINISERLKSPKYVVLFLFGNLVANIFYSKYFYERSFYKKYREIDDRSLENIINTLEANMLNIK